MDSEVEILEPNKGGRPSEFTQEVFDDICEQMAKGKSLRQVCDSPDMPNRSTFLRWVKGADERQAQYQLSRDASFDWIAEEAIRIADDSAGDYFIEDRDGKSVVVPDHARVQRARLQVDTRKWILSKIAPRKYGDKVELLSASTEGQDSGQAMAISWKPSVRVIVYPMLGSDGRVLNPGTPEYDEAIERAAQAARAHGETQAEVGIKLDLEGASAEPLRISYQPAPLPGNLTDSEWSLMQEVLSLVKRTIPSDDNSPPETILRIIREALLMHFREVEIESKATAA